MTNDLQCEALTFASNYLASVACNGTPTFKGGYYPKSSNGDTFSESVIVEVNIALSSAPAQIMLTVPHAWRVLVPYVQCHEPWFRRGVLNWHAFSDSGMCYIHWEEWRDSLDVIEAECGAGAVLSMGAALCVQLSVQLMQRHLRGYRLKLKDWPKEWLCWSHGDDGTAEYRAEKKKRLAELARAYRKSPEAAPK